MPKSRLLQPTAIIFGTAITFVVVAHINVANWYREFGNEPIDVFPDHLLEDPYVLVFASVMLVIRKWWSSLIALVVSARLVYLLGYLSLLSERHGFDEARPSWVVHHWFVQKYLWQPQELLHLGLALIVVVYAASQLVSKLLSSRTTCVATIE